MELNILRITNEVLPVVINFMRASVIIARGFAAASTHISFAPSVRDVAGGGLVFSHLWCTRRDGKILAGDGVSRGR